MTIDASLNKRLDRVVRKHRRMRTNGVKFHVGRDGLIIAKPRLVRPQVPLKGFFLVVALLFAFKSLLYAQMGPNIYALNVAELQAGTQLERVGGFLLQVEPVTEFAGTFLSQYFYQR